MRASDNPEWKRIKRGIRDIKQACERIDPIKNGSGIRCRHEADVFQDKVRKIFQEKRRKRR